MAEADPASLTRRVMMPFLDPLGRPRGRFSDDWRGVLGLGAMSGAIRRKHRSAEGRGAEAGQRVARRRKGGLAACGGER